MDLADELFDSQVSPKSIDVLIGSDNYWDFVTGETKRGDDGPIAVKSTLGWLLSGRVNGTIDPVTHSNLIIECQNSLFAPSQDQDDILTNTLKEFWETESIGIKDLPADQDTRKESFAFDVKLNGGRYEVKLPWKEDRLPSSDHYQLCENRLRSLHHKLRKDPALLTEYDNIIQEQLNTGIIEEVSSGDFNNEKATQIHYLPHHAVVRKDRETTKVRIVYDGSAKTSKDDNSLNDCLETGPNCIPHVFDMLANFRKNTVCLTADIEKAFLMSRFPPLLVVRKSTLGETEDCTLQIHSTRVWVTPLACYSWRDNQTSLRAAQTKRPGDRGVAGKFSIRRRSVNGRVR